MHSSYLIKFLFVMLFLSVFSIGKTDAQDLLVTTAGDTIKCKVTTKDSMYLSYLVANDYNIVETHQILLSDVATFFPESDLSTSTSQFVIVPQSKPRNFCITLSLGYAKALGTLETVGDVEADDINRSMTNGLGYGVGFNYYFPKNIGIGFFLDGYFSWASAASYYKLRWNKIFFGPAFVAQSKSPHSKTIIDGLIGLGPVFFSTNNGWNGWNGATLTATSFGVNFGGGIAYLFNPKIATGIRLSLAISSISGHKYKGEVQDPDKRYSLSHLMIAVYCRFP